MATKTASAHQYDDFHAHFSIGQFCAFCRIFAPDQQKAPAALNISLIFGVNGDKNLSRKKRSIHKIQPKQAGRTWRRNCNAGCSFWPRRSTDNRYHYRHRGFFTCSRAKTLIYAILLFLT